MIDNDWDPALYDQRHNFVTRGGQPLLDLLDAKPGERMLDLGCGTGHHVRQLADRGVVAIGLDSAPDMIAAAQAAYPDLEFRVADGTDFRVEAPFDAVFSNAALHWMTRPASVAACVAAALRPGGRFVAEMGGKGNIMTIAQAAREAIADLLRIEIRHRWYFPSPGEYAGLLEGAGFEVRAMWLFDRPTPLEGDEGMLNWMRMFGGGLFPGVPDGALPEAMRLAERRLRDSPLYAGGRWVADYRRLRFVAVKNV